MSNVSHVSTRYYPQSPGSQRIRVALTATALVVGLGWAMSPGQSSAETNCSPGAGTTFYTERYDSGQTMSISEQIPEGEDGILHGKSLTLYENGQSAGEQHYTCNVLNGVYRLWYENGQLKLESNYQNGVQAGHFRTWHDNGALESEGDYTAGKQQGEWTVWHANGQLASHGSYQSGAKVGDWVYFDANGVPIGAS